MGKDLVTNKTIVHSQSYDNKGQYTEFKFNFNAFLQHLCTKHAVPSELYDDFMKCNSFSSLCKYVTDNSIIEINSVLDNITQKCTWGWGNKFDEYIISKFIHPVLPKMWYFDEYFTMPSEVNINHFINRSSYPSYLSDEEYKVVKALFDLSGIDPNDMIKSQDFESFKSKLEATSNKITDAMFEYWKTNTNLEIEFASETKNNELILYIRIKNINHRITLPLKNRSKGFAWFFSFLVWFSQIENASKNKYILLLDEPGLNLHASAQDDLLRFLNEKLAPNYQVIYTTHSPFMIDMQNLTIGRTVYDSQDSKIGSIVSEVIQEKDPDTLFPFQAAIGYDLAQNLFISKNNLLVEGVSDLIYLNVISSLLQNMGRIGLSDEITIIPTGGLDKVVSFISLLRGSKLNIACALDRFTDQKSKERLDSLIKQKIVSEKNILFFSNFSSNGYDLEDMFEKKEYLKLFNKAFKNRYEIKLSDIKDNNKPILPQINAFLNIKRFNHFTVADSLLRMPEKSKLLSSTTLDRFEELFNTINPLFNK